jgi:hypothetical protein
MVFVQPAGDAERMGITLGDQPVADVVLPPIGAGAVQRTVAVAAGLPPEIVAYRSSATMPSVSGAKPSTTPARAGHILKIDDLVAGLA